MTNTVEQGPAAESSTAKLARLVRATEYFARYPNLFPKPNSWRYFVNRRRELLERRGLIVKLTSGVHVDAAALDEQLVALMTSVDGEPGSNGRQFDLPI